MIMIGLRASPKEVTYALLDTGGDAVVDIDQIVVPTAMAWPAALKYIRSNLLDILREYDVVGAGIRLTENNAQSLSVDRVHLEGVIQEAFASSSVKGYFAGAIPAMAARLGIDSSDMKLMIKGRNDLDVEGWDEMTEKQREALLAAMSANNV
jgi:hypothetical protein